MGGFDAVGEAFISAGWGMVGLAAYQSLSIGFSALAWQAIMRSVWQGSIGLYFWARWVRESMNSLLPVAQVGGDIVGARLLAIN